MMIGESVGRVAAEIERPQSARAALQGYKAGRLQALCGQNARNLIGQFTICNGLEQHRLTGLENRAGERAL